MNNDLVAIRVVFASIGVHPCSSDEELSFEAAGDAGDAEEEILESEAAALRLH